MLLYRFVGSKLQEHRGAFKLSYPMEHGVVVDWQDMERVRFSAGSLVMSGQIYW